MDTAEVRMCDLTGFGGVVTSVETAVDLGGAAEVAPASRRTAEVRMTAKFWSILTYGKAKGATEAKFGVDGDVE